MPTDLAQMIGRDAELASLEELLAAARAGRAVSGLVEGEAGIGKSALVGSLMKRARADGFHVVLARAEELEQGIPFAPLVHALDVRTSSSDPQRASLGRILSERRALGAPTEMVHIAVEGFAGLVESLAAERPTLLVVEDLHWSDRATLIACLSFARRLVDLPIATIFTTRPSTQPEVQQLVSALARAGTTMVPLMALSADDERALVAWLVEGEPGSELMGKVAGASGNPLFITELVRALEADGAIVAADLTSAGSEISIPPTLGQTILRRLTSIPDATLDALRQASLLGTSFTAADLATVMGTSVWKLEPLLQEPLRTGVLVPRDGRLAFRHDLVRDAIYDDIPESIRNGLHREAAAALEAAGAPLLQVALHLGRGAARGDKAAIARLYDAAEAVFWQDPLAAVDLIECAFSLYDPSDPERDRQLDLALKELGIAGKADEIEAYCRRKLVAEPPPTAEAVLRAELMQKLAMRGARDEAYGEADRLLELDWVPDHARAYVVQQVAGFFWSRGDAERALAAGERIVAITASGHVDPLAVPGAMFILTWIAFADGRIADALAWCDRVEDIIGSRMSGDVRGVVLSDADRMDESLECFVFIEKKMGELLGRDVASLPGGLIRVARAAIKLQHGEWEDAQAEFDASWEEVRDTELDIKLWPLVCLMVMALARGQMDECERLYQLAEAALAVRPVRQGMDGILSGRALMLERSGDGAGALQLLRTYWEAVRPFRNPTVFRTLAPSAVRIAMACEDGGFAANVTADAETWAGKMSGVASADATVMRCRAYLTGDPDHFLHAVELYSRVPDRVFEGALVREEAATGLVRAGRVEEAKPLFEAAVDVYDRIGATAYAARAAAVMREAGLRRGARGKRGRPTAGWESLTPTEETIVGLVAEGLRNAEIGARLFISPHTVSTHLRHIFGKLSVASRVELTKEYANRRALGHAR